MDEKLQKIIVLGIFFLFSFFVFRTSVPELGIVTGARAVDYKIFKDQEAGAFSSINLSVPRSEGAKRENTESVDPFKNLDIEAKSAYVFDLKENKVLFEKDSDVLRPLASITKLMTALVSEERIPAGFYVPISIEAIREEGDDGFRAGDKFKKEDLLNYMLVSSSNDAAYALAGFVGSSLDGNGSTPARFVMLMNQRARELDFLSLSFSNPNGLDIKDGGGDADGAEGSAKDVAGLMEYLFQNHNSMMLATGAESIKIVSDKNRVISGVSTNKSFSLVPRILASKTGYTDLAGGNLVFIFDAGFEHPIVVSILGSSEEGRFFDAAQIANAVLIYFASEKNGSNVGL